MVITYIYKYIYTYTYTYTPAVILIFRITALAYTTLDGLLAVFLHNISYIVKA